MPVFDHQLGGQSLTLHSTWLPHAPAYRTPTCLSLQSAMSFQTPLATAALQMSTTANRMEEGGVVLYIFVNIVWSYRYMLHDLIRFNTTAHKTLVPCLNYFDLHENLCFLLKTMWKVCKLCVILLVAGRKNHRSSRFRMKWIILWWGRPLVTLLNMWPQRLPSWCNCICFSHYLFSSQRSKAVTDIFLMCEYFPRSVRPFLASHFMQGTY